MLGGIFGEESVSKAAPTIDELPRGRDSAKLSFRFEAFSETELLSIL